MATKAFIHVGYGKTATSWFQNKVFAQLDPAVYLGKRDDEFPRWIIDINYLDPIAYDARKDHMRRDLKERIAGRESVLISSEAFTNLTVLHQQAHRINDLFEDPRVILVLRHPIKWLVSNYKYCVEFEDFHLNFEDYLDFGERRTPFALEKRPPFYLPDFFYDETVNLYRNLLGDDRVLVMKYEDFTTDPMAFGKRLGEFMDLDLPDLSEMAKIKVLASKSDHVVAQIRMENLRRLMERCIGKGISSDIAKLLNPVNRPLMTDEIHEKLRKLFTPHCSEYYPDLIKKD